MIYVGEIIELFRADLKMVQNCEISKFLGLEIRHSGFGRRLTSLILDSEDGGNLAFWLWGWLKSGILPLGVVGIWHSGFWLGLEASKRV